MFGFFSSPQPEEIIYPEIPTPTTKEEYEKIIQEKLEGILHDNTKEFTPIAYVDNGDGGFNDIQLYDLPVDPTKPVQGVKVVATLPASPKVIADLLWNTEFRKKIEKDLLMMDPVEVITENIHVIKTRIAVPFPVTARETVTVRHTFERDGTYYNLAFSINHKGVKADNNFVRAVLYVSVMICKPNPDGTTEFTRVTQMDPKGNIPTFVIGLTKTKAADFVVALRHAVLEQN